MKKTKKIFLWILGILAVLVIASGTYIHFHTYNPTSSAQIAAKSAKEDNKTTTFTAKNNKMTVIFYTGALVKPDSYSIWAKQVAKNGYTVKIVHFPLNLAILNQNAAPNLVSKKQDFVIGGHSLGGAMATRFANNYHDKNLKGVFLLGAYADQKGRLDKTNLPVLSLTANRDNVLNWKKYNDNKKYLPKDTKYVTIKGGNHGGFGSYGHQKGDKTATISNKEQQKIIAYQITKWLNQIKK